MDYLPTFPLECGHFSPNVGKYSLHGSYGVYDMTLRIQTPPDGVELIVKKKIPSPGQRIGSGVSSRILRTYLDP